MTVPRDLQATIARKELRYSLKTGNLSTAKNKARFIAGQVQLFFRDVRKGYIFGVNSSKEKIQRMIKKFMQKTIASYDQPVLYDQYDEDLARQSYWEDRSIKDEVDHLEWIKEGFNSQLQKGDYSEIEDEADLLLSKEGVAKSNIDKGSSAYAELCTGILSAQIKGIEYRQKRLGGKPRNDLGDLLDDCLPGAGQPMIPGNNFKQENHPVSGPEDKKLSKVIPLFVAEDKVKWTEKTEQEVIASLDLFIEVIGDLPIQSVNRAKVAEYKSTLVKLPPNKNKAKRYRNKSIPELMEMTIEKTLSRERVNKNLQRAGALFEYARQHGIYDGPNPATKMQLPKDKWEVFKRAPYINSELEMLFQSEQYLQDSFSRHYMFWTPIIALFHGMRQNEIAGLFIEDIKKSEEGVWYFDLFSRKSNPSDAYRVAPIHPFLIEELNFLTHIKNLKAQRQKQLFPELKKGRDGYAKAVSNWFNSRYKDKCGIVSPDGRKRDFHSFRTTFITRLRHKKVHDRMLKEVVGHSVNIDVTDLYTDPYPMKQLFDEVVSRASFHKEIDLSHLKDSRFVPR
jgi:integrase